MKNLPKLAFVFFLLTTVVSIFMRIYVSSKLATKGGEVRAYEEKIYELSRENEEIKRTLASLSSLSAINTKARTLAMIKPLSSDFLTPLPSASVNLASSL